MIMTFQKAIQLIEEHGHVTESIGFGFVQLIDTSDNRPYKTIHVKDGQVRDGNETMPLKQWLGY